MGSRILAFRQAVVVDRLAPRNEACPLSLRDLLLTAGPVPCVLPIVRAPIAGVARAALVAAKEAGSAIGLALPPAVPPEAWFEAVTQAADELAAAFPIFLSAEVTAEGADGAAVERASHEAFRLVDAGITHLAVDVRAVPAAARAATFAAVAAPALEQGTSVDCVVSLEDSPRRLVDEAGGLGAPPDVLSVRCAAAAAPADVRAQVARLARICAEVPDLPVLRRGPVTPLLLDALARSPVRGCEDGGQAATAGISVIPWDQIAPVDEGSSRTPALDLAADELSASAADRLEALAYVEVAAFIERLGAAGSGRVLAEALERRLEER